MYVAVKGGERAIDNAHDWLAEERRGPTVIPELSVDQIKSQMTLAVCESSVADERARTAIGYRPYALFM